MRIDDKPFSIGAIFSAQHSHIRGHMKTLDALAEVSKIHLCAVEGGELDEISMLSQKVTSGTYELDEFFGRDDVDFVVVCVRNDISASILMRCVQENMHFMFEKPGAMNADELREVAKAAEAQRLTTGVMFQNRWKPSVQDAKQALADGAFGEIMTVETRLATSQVRFRNPNGWMFKKETAGSGILAWLACHHIDMACYLLDDRVTEIAGMVGTQSPEPLGVEDTAFISMRFAGGPMGTVHAGYHLAGPMPKTMGGSDDSFVALRGTRGYARIDSSRGDLYGMFSDAPGWASGGYREKDYELPRSEAYGGVYGEQFVLSHLKASRTAERGPTSIEDAVHVLEVIDATLKSSRTGNFINIPD